MPQIDNTTPVAPVLPDNSFVEFHNVATVPSTNPSNNPADTPNSLDPTNGGVNAGTGRSLPTVHVTIGNYCRVSNPA